MEHPVDLEGLSAAFTDHPWLAEAIRNGAWWDTGEGRVELLAPLADPHELRQGLAALSDALGIDAAVPTGRPGWRSRPLPRALATAARRSVSG